MVAVIGTAPVAASTGDDLTIEHSEVGLANQSADHMWSHDVKADDEIAKIRLDYSGTGTDGSDLTSDEVSININGDWDTAHVRTVTGEDVLTLTLREPVEVTDTDDIEVHANEKIVNPDAGTHKAAIELHNESTSFSDATVTFDVVGVGTLNGQVTNSSTGEPIVDATVTADNRSKNIHLETVTNETGWYSMDVGALQYNITADTDWYTSNDTQDVPVTADEATTTNAELDPAGAIIGKVTDTDNNRIERVEVIAENMTKTSFSSFGTWTDSDGTFRIDVDPEKEYNVTVKSKFHQNEERTFLTVEQGKETDTGTIELAPSYTPVWVNGTVTNTTGDPIEDATVEAVNQSAENNFDTLVHYERETDASGEYAIAVPEGGTSIGASAPWYSENETVVTAPKDDVDFALEQSGTLTGTIKDSNENGIENVMVSIYPPEGGTGLDYDHTNSDGSFSLSAPAGTYDLGIFHDDYPDEFHQGVEIVGGVETVEDHTLEDPGQITGVVKDQNGDPIQGVEVSTLDTSHTNFANDATDANGEFTFNVAPGTYEVTVKPDDYPTERSAGITIEEGGSAEVAFELVEPSYISGEVTNESGSLVEDVFVVAESDGNSHFEYSTNGEYNLSVPAGTHRVMVFAEDGYVPGEDIETNLGETHEKDFTLVNVTVLDESVEVVSGSGVDEADLGVTAEMQGPLAIWLTNESGSQPSQGMPNELEGLNVDDDTVFEINVTVKNFNPDSLLWAAEDVEWETSDNETEENATDVTIRTKAVNMQGVTQDGDGNDVHIGPLFGQDPSDVRWPSNEDDGADIGWNQTVYIGMFDQSNAPESVQESLKGMTVTTNAQAFSMPTVSDDSLEVWVGGPSRTTAGEPHEGFYQAFIPNALLDSWGVDDPEEDLEALYRGDSTAFTVEETNDGAWIEIDDIHYSAGFIEVEADPDGADASSSSTSSSSSSSSSSRSTSDRDPEPEVIDTPEEIEEIVDVPEDVEPQRTETIDIERNEETGESQATFSDESSIESITFSKEAEGSSTVTELDSEPEETGASPGRSVSTIQITVPDENKDSAATIRNRIPRDRIDDIEAEAEDLRINRFNEAAGGWQGLETEVVEETDDRVVLEAETPGFSVFTVSVVGQPTAVINAPSEGEANTDVTLNAEDSVTPYGDITEYDWTINGESYDSESVTHAFDTPGKYAISLSVTNDGGEIDTVETTVTITETESATEPETESEPESDSESELESEPEPEDQPGFGVAVALISLLIGSRLITRK